MEVTLELLDLEQALELAPSLDAYVGEITAEFRDEPVEGGVARRLFERHFGEPETLVLTAWRESEGRSDGPPIGVCVTVPLVDPLLGDRLPLVVLLHVDRDYRHRGLAHQLIEHASRELESRGIRALAARAGHNDDALISMGERWGFTRVWELMVRE